MERTSFIFLVAMLWAAAVWARPTPSCPWTPGTTPPVNADTVSLYLRLEPLVQAIEEQQRTTVEEVYRSHLYHRKERVAFRLEVLEEQLEADTGVPIEEFVRLKLRILGIHKLLFALEKLREERLHLLQVWKLQLEHDTAPDELFVARRMHLDDHIAEIGKLLDEYPPEARGAVQSHYKGILATFKRPKPLTWAEQRERRERANELLPQPPANPYREGFFDEF